MAHHDLDEARSLAGQLGAYLDDERGRYSVYFRGKHQGSTSDVAELVRLLRELMRGR